ncbi:AraC family transcriptional regulator [Caulobacter sp. 602-2]|uniref:AraC family transcriptional regulator n=1 Tax=Caulobacter sp. 602-2 TaxID=2710887 RepID=A0A6G4QU40_9CAUL|nr:helix-turn-helix transcriptional regulator [Caulobacter sp. 602-2]NGM48957.1 AraC family transcriptional regulator [Caulobacter sp. 602-2]
MRTDEPLRLWLNQTIWNTWDRSPLPTETPEPPFDKSSADHPPIRPVVGLHGRQAKGYYDPPHVHDRAQFSYRLEGVAAVRAGGSAILLPPGRGVWIPPGLTHEVSCRGPAAYNALYVTPKADPQPRDLKVIDVTPFLHALVEEFLTFEPAYDEAGREGQIVRLMLGEIDRAPASAYAGPRLPRDPRVRRICDALRIAPADDRDIDAWAQVAGMSRRTFTRAFRAETGMGFTTWRQQLRMTEAAARLEAGQSVKQAAQDLGFTSASSFVTLFQRSFGVSPGRYAATTAQVRGHGR